MPNHQIPNSIVVANGKGGVGKTSMCAHLAGYAAAAGWNVLAVDLDEQGNLARDLGYLDESDNGESLTNAWFTTNPAIINIVNVRERLDVVAGGDHLRRVGHAIVAERAHNANAVRTLGETLQTIAGRYDLVVFDTPPATSNVFVDSAFACAGNLVIPTRIDDASIDGIATTARRFAEARQTHNPELCALGVVLFGVGTQDTRLVASARESLDELLQGVVPVLDPTIRFSRKAPVDMRSQGVLAYEYEHAAINAAAEAEPWYRLVARGEKPGRSYSRSASGLASDYQAVVTDLLGRFSQKAVR